MERVKKGERYWFVINDGCGYFTWDYAYEENSPYDDDRFANNNYFQTKEEAEAVASKIRIVLKGADVIEMPSKPLGLTDIKNNHLRNYVPERLSINDLKAFALGFWEGCDWLASKIVK